MAFTPGLFIPPELADLIIGHLRNDMIALYACSLVCHAWVPRSRQYIFEEISLDFCGDWHPRSPFSDDTMRSGLEDGDEEGAQVEVGEWLEAAGAAEEDAHTADAEDAELEEDNESRVDNSHNNGFRVPTLWQFRPAHPQSAYGFLDLLKSPHCTVKPHIRRLSIASITTAAASASILGSLTDLPALSELVITQTYLSAAATDAIATNFPHLLTLTLHFANLAADVWALVARLPSLTALELCRTHWLHKTTAPPPLTLDKLEATSRDIARLLPYVAHRPCGHLTVNRLRIPNWRKQDFRAITTVFTRLGGLAVLNLDFPMPWNRRVIAPTEFTNAVDLSAHAALHTLSIVHCNARNTRALERALLMVLKHPPPALARITLTVDAYIPSALDFASSELDTAFASFVGLQTVSIRFMVEGEVQRRRMTNATTAVRAMLPKLEQRGILEVIVKAIA